VHRTHACGERNGAAKLTTKIVAVIRSRHRAGERVLSIAQDYGVRSSTVYRVLAREHWRSTP
jgi:Mor family transcriptional regulator